MQSDQVHQTVGEDGKKIGSSCERKDLNIKYTKPNCNCFDKGKISSLKSWKKNDSKRFGKYKKQKWKYLRKKSLWEKIPTDAMFAEERDILQKLS